MEQSEEFLTTVGKYADLLLLSGREGADTKHLGRDIEKHFSGIKMRMIGDGKYAAVFTHPFYKDRVIKVGLSRPSKFSDDQTPDAMQDAWLNYATMVMQLAPSPYIPKIYSVRLMEHSYVAEMELLKPAYSAERLGKTGPFTRKYISSFTKAVQRAAQRAYGWEKLVKNLSAHAGFNRTNFDYLVRLFRGIGAPTDLHYDNIMARGKNLVVTDPYHHKGTIVVKVSASNYAEKRNGVSIVSSERMSNGQAGVRYVHGTISAPSWAEIESDALRPKPVYAVQPHVERLSGILSQVRYERVPSRSNILTRLR